MERVAAAAERAPYSSLVVVPRPLKEMVTQRVVVMTWLDGERLHTALEGLGGASTRLDPAPAHAAAGKTRTRRLVKRARGGW